MNVDRGRSKTQRMYRLSRANAMLDEYGRGGIEVLAATGDIVDDAMDVASDIIMDVGYFMNAVASGVETGKPIEATGIATQKLLVDLVGAIASIAGSIVVGGSKAGEVMSRVATEATKLRPSPAGAGAGSFIPIEH